MSKPKVPFSITGPGIYKTRIGILVEIFDRPVRLYRIWDPEVAPGTLCWVGEVYDGSTGHWNNQGNPQPPLASNLQLTKRMVEYDTQEEADEAANKKRVAAELRFNLTETGLRRNVWEALENATSGYGFYEQVKKKRPYPFKTWLCDYIGAPQRLKEAIKETLESLDDIYGSTLNQRAGFAEEFDTEPVLTLTRRPGKKGGLPKMENAEDFLIYVANRLDISLKQKPWCIPTIKLPAAKTDEPKN